MQKEVAAVAIAAGLWLAALAGPASAATISVTPGSSDEAGMGAACSLREAVQSINNAANFGGCVATIAPNPYGTADEIDVPAGHFTLSQPGAGEDLNATGDLDFRKPAKVVGAGDSAAGTEIDAASIDRVLDLPSVAATVAVTVQDLRLSNGNAVAADGGAIRVSDVDGKITVQGSTIEGSDAGQKGGAIFFEGATGSTPINVVDSELVGNSAVDDGGAIEYGNTASQAAIERSSLIGNHSDAEGGGVYLSSPAIGPFASLRVKNSTFDGNTATAGGGAFGFGGGQPQVFSIFSTITGNSTPAAGEGGAIRTDATNDQVALSSSIVAANTAAGVPASCGGPVTGSYIGSFSVLGDSSCPVVGMANLSGTDPMLAPLGAYGGPTRTLALYEGSPAIDHVPSASCTIVPQVDQRSEPRPAGAACDSGAFEGSVPKPVSAAPATATATAATPAKKKCKKKKKRHAATAAKKKCKRKK